MQKELLATADKLNKNHKKESWWKRVVRTMAMFVVFCTTYALILPAITIDIEPFCGIDDHVHGESCYEIREYELLDCGVTRAIHSHDDFCMDAEGSLACTLEERQPHQHGDGCYETLEGHSHGEECFDEAGELICGLEEGPEETVLSCGVEDPDPHQHDDSCWGLYSEEILVCEQPEHVHGSECMADLNADVESAADWEETFSHLELTNNWAPNLAMIARTQIGYTESERNFILDGAQNIKGYSRYGEWFGTPYARWDVTFAAFCMEYAGVGEEAIAEKGKIAKWTEQLEEVTRLPGPEEYLPREGDLVFFVRNGEETCGIVSLVDDGYYRVIAGDVNDRVTELELEAENLLYSCDIRTLQTELEALAAATEATEAAEPTEETEATEPTEVTEPAEEGEPTEATETTEPTEETEPTESAEPTEPTEATESTEPTEPIEVTEATEPTEPTEVTEATEPAGTEEKITCVAETENYIVTVSYNPSLILPEGTQLRVVEYARDSEVFRQRCLEAGYELEWLLNIGFFLEDRELDLNGQFDVVVTGKQGNSLGTDITHFAESGTERIAGTEEEDGTVSFSSEGFSDFGGGVARAAAQMATVNLGLYSYNQYCPINFGSGNTLTCPVGSTLTLTLKDSGCNYSAPKLNITGGELVSQSFQCGTAGHQHTMWCGTEPTHTIVIRVTGTNVSITGQVDGASWNNALVAVSSSGGTTEPEEPEPTEPTEPTEPSEPTEPTEPEIDTSYPGYPNYPEGVHTGNVTINRLRFYNICEGNGQVSALPGCVFEIEGNNGYTATITSGSTPEVELPAGIPDGICTITEISAPSGYFRDTRYEREFRIENGMLVSEHNVGTFINHNISGLKQNKSAQVQDYTSRIYEVLLEAEADLRMYEMEPIEVLFVVDQSNSMLFPSAMEDTGYDITLTMNGSNNVWRNRQVFDALDKRQVYYIVADPEGSATAWAIWYDGNHWMCQDSSYYAKAKHENATGYQTPGELAIFPEYADYSAQPTERYGQKARANGAGLDKNLQGSSLGKHLDTAQNDTRTYTLYTAKDEYNRLHYLEESLANIIYALADANPKNRITLVPFTKTVQTGIPDPEIPGRNISMPAELNTTNARKLVNVVTHINTSGGTRQDLALEYTYNNYLRYNQDGKDPDHTYTILITDGAPVESDDKSLSAIYSDIRNYGNRVKNESVLMSVALGMDTVTGGSAALKEIATSDQFYCPLSDAAELVETMQDILFQGFTRGPRIETKADFIDEITDSFYPIAWASPGQGALFGREVIQQDPDREWIILRPGDWITVDGRMTTNATEQAGQLQRREDGTFYIQWKEVLISNEGGWKGKFYIKAKEDFIGGNVIQTNKMAELTTKVNANPLDPLNKTVELPKPSVNVRLLDMNEHSSLVTVYLGDLVNSPTHSPLDSLRIFYNDTRVEKILSGLGDVKNKYDAAEGLGESTFDLAYAMGRKLSEEEWQTLTQGGTVIVPYIYDNASSTGPVGQFSFRLEKRGIEGANPDFAVHEATAACQPGGHPLTESCNNCAETYILHIDYTAYRMGQQGRPAANTQNGPKGPGTEVGTGQTLETGLGTVEKDNVHEVHVISGSIRIYKEFAEGVTDETDQTFTFTLHRQEDGEDTSRDRTASITIPAGRTAGTAAVTFSNLARGTYTVTEDPHEFYMVDSITVTDATNTASTPPIGGSAKTVTFRMGSNIGGSNVIGPEDPQDLYTAYIDPVNGVFGEAVFTNEVIVYYGDVPVEKIWDDGAENHSTDAVYLVLYLDDAPVTDAEGKHRILRLDESSHWKGAFQVALANKEDSVENYHYSVREADQVAPTSGIQGVWHAALLENDGESILYYDRALESMQLLSIGNIPYAVRYSVRDDGVLIVENYRSVTLPVTGGTGTELYTTGGWLLIAAALVMGCCQRRRRERRTGE